MVKYIPSAYELANGKYQGRYLSISVDSGAQKEKVLLVGEPQDDEQSALSIVKKEIEKLS